MLTQVKSLSIATDKLKNKISHIPESPGVYKMLDYKGRIIYVGKSKSLKSRVKTYFSTNPKWEKVKKMAASIDDIEYEVTDTHLEAMLLECELIKMIKPIFNFQMKNDMRYVYLRIEDYNRNANPLKLIGYRDENCYGPFRSRHFLHDIMNSLKNIYPIKKAEGRFVFEYHLFPVHMDLREFNENKESLTNIFSGDKGFSLFVEAVTDKMKESSNSCNFEMASMYRDLIKNICYLKSGISRHEKIISQNILLKIPVQHGCKLFFISKGSIVAKEKYVNPDESDIEIFVQKALNLASGHKSTADEKSQLDFRDILCSEVSGLPNEMVTIY